MFAIVPVTLLFLIACLILEWACIFTKCVNMLTIYVALFLLYLKLLFWFFFWGITPLEKRCWLMTSLSKSSNPCVSQVTQKPFLLLSVEIEKWLRQSTSFTGLTCESSRLPLDPNMWHDSYFCLELMVCNSDRIKQWTTCLCSEVSWMIILKLKCSYQNFVY